MAIERQYIEFPLTKGVDTATDPVSQGGMMSLDNAEPDKFGLYSARSAISDVSKGAHYLSCVEADGVAYESAVYLPWVKSVDSFDDNLMLVGRTGQVGSCQKYDSDSLVSYIPDLKMVKNHGPVAPHDMSFTSVAKTSTYCEMTSDILYAVGFGGPFYGVVTWDGTTARLSVTDGSGRKIVSNREITCYGTGTIGACPKIIAVEKDTHGVNNAHFAVLYIDTTNWRVGWNRYHANPSVTPYGMFAETTYYATCATSTPDNAVMAAIRVDHPTQYQCMLVAHWDSANHMTVREYKISDYSQYSILSTGMTASATLYDVHLAHAGHDYGSGKRSVYMTWAYLTGGNYTIRGRVIEYGTSSLSAPHAADTIGIVAVSGYANCRVSSCSDSAYGEESNNQWVMYSIGSTSYDTLAAPSRSYLSYVTFGGATTAVLTQPGSTLGQIIRSKTTGKIIACFSICYTDSASPYTITQPTYVVGELSIPDYGSSDYYWRPIAVVFPKKGSYSGAHKIIGTTMYVPTSSTTSGDVIAFNCVKQNNQAGYTNSYEYFWVTFDETSRGRSTSRDTVAGNRYYAGAVTSYFDTSKSYEVNYIQHPIVEWQASTSEASGIAGSNTYQYCAIYEMTNANGEVERSGVSNVVSVTLGADPFYHVDIRVTCDVFGWYSKNRSGLSDMRIELYRTAAGSAGPFYRCASALHAYDPSITYIQIHDTSPDSTIQTQELLYTTGNVLENTIPPPSSSVCQHNQRLFLVNQADRNEIWYSKTKEQGVALEFAEEFTFRLQTEDGDPITQLASMDGYLFLFTDNAIYRMHGDGPNKLGEGSSFPNPIKICSSVGALDNTPTLLTDMGLIFVARTGIHMLSRKMQTQFIGEPVKEYRARTIRSMVHVPSEKRIIFVISGVAGSDPEIPIPPVPS